MSSVASPVFVRCADLDPLVVFTRSLLKAMDVGEKVAMGAIPVPVNETLGLVGALLLSVSVAVRVPRAVGVNTMLTVQFADGARLAPQLLLWLKSPVTVNPEIRSVPVPVFLSITFWAPLDVPTCWDANERDVPENEAPGTTPVPFKETDEGDPGKSPLIASVPDRLPVIVGVKTTFTAQLDPGESEVPQLFDCEKSPEAEMELKLSAIVPLLVMVTAEGAELVPRVVEPKVRLPGDIATADAPPVPVRNTSCVLPLVPPELSVIVTFP